MFSNPKQKKEEKKEMGEETKNEGRFSKEEEAKAQVDIWRFVFGFTEMAAVKCAIELGIADVLESHQTPVTLNHLSSLLNSSPSLLYRLMRFLIYRGIFKEETTHEGSLGYVQTPLSRFLTKNGDQSMAAFVLFETSSVMLAPFLALHGRVSMKRASAFEAVHGEDVWKYAENAPVHSQLLNDAMACHARVAVPAIVDECPEIFEGISSLVDVGGGDGTSLRILVKAFPWITGINFDLPHVVSVAPSHNDTCVVHIGGDMFHSVPKANAALLMWVLHDWGDEECIRILKNCREAVPEDNGKVIIAEAVIDSGEGKSSKFEDVGLMLDMVMMAHTTNGKERTSKEWVVILKAAGFTRYDFKKIEAVQSLIVAYP